MKKLILGLMLLLWAASAQAGTLYLDKNPCMDFVQTMERYISEKNFTHMATLGNMLYGYYMGMIGSPGVPADGLMPFVEKFSEICARNPGAAMLDVLKRMPK